MNRVIIQSTLLSKIYNNSFKEKHRLGEFSFTRKRSLSFATIISLILQKITKSLQIEVNLLGDLLKSKPVTKQALSKARYKIGVSAFQDLHESTLSMYYTNNQIDYGKSTASLEATVQLSRYLVEEIFLIFLEIILQGHALERSCSIRN